MSEHKEKFSGRVKEYAQYRARYSTQIIATLEAQCGLRKEDVIADVGAGTGMLAELFLEHGNSVIAVEPNAEMLAVCAAMQERHPALRTVMASAEETTLADASVDFVVVGRAFHWFDAERARAEFARILRPGGWLVLASVGRRREDTTPVGQGYREVLQRITPEYAEIIKRFNIYDNAEQFFAGSIVLRELFESEELMTLEMLIGQTQSISFAPLAGEAGHAAMVEMLTEFFARYAENGTLRMPMASYLICIQLGRSDTSR